MTNKKNIIMVILCILVCIMSVAYAMLATDLVIKGKTAIDSVWDIAITNINEKNKIGQASSKTAPSYTSTTATFDVSLIQPGDSISYDVKIKNSGTLNAIVNSISVLTDDNDAIIYEVSGIKENDRLDAGKETTLTVKVTFNENATQILKQTKNVTIVINYAQYTSSN